MVAIARITQRLLYPLIVFRGIFFTKDVYALLTCGQDNNFNFSIIDAVLAVNEKQRIKLLDKVLDYFGNIEGKKFALWGLSFKPDTDDTREAPALYLIDELLKRGANVVAFDPEAMKNVKKQIGDKIAYVENQYDALDGADALLIATEWAVFKNPDFNLIKSKLKTPLIFDGRNLFNLSDMQEKGLYYSSIGHQTIIPNLK